MRCLCLSSTPPATPCSSSRGVLSRQHLAAPHQPARPASPWQPVRGSHHQPQRTWTAATPPSTSTGSSQPAKPEDDEFQGLLPEEDFEVPGTYFDALSSSTKLGKAVKAAVEELEHLGGLEAEVLTECDDLLKKLGVKGSLFGSGGDNPLLKLQQELQQLEELEQQELQKQQQEPEQQK